MKPSLVLRMGQQLTMTPQLQQAIRLLQLSTLDLQQEIQDVPQRRKVIERQVAASGRRRIDRVLPGETFERFTGLDPQPDLLGLFAAVEQDHLKDQLRRPLLGGSHKQRGCRCTEQSDESSHCWIPLP